MTKQGRPRKFNLGDIVNYDGEWQVVVDHRLRGTKSEYRCIALNYKRKRYGRAVWRSSGLLTATGEHSNTGSILTYRANEYLEAELGRGCDCHCCIHTAIPRSEFNRASGELREADDNG